MRAIVSSVAGGPETLRLEDVAEPQPGPGQVRIAVDAVGVNYPDLLIIEDKYQFKPARPFSPGAEVSGRVDAVGAGVTSVRPGQRVLAMVGWGGMADKVLAPLPGLSLIPDAMPAEHAAALLLTYATSYHALKDRARLQPGESLLVLGASGGVGLAAVELGRAMGATVLAATSTQEKLDVALAAGASAGAVYGTDALDTAGQRALATEFKALCQPHGPHVIYDPVGGNYAEPALRSIAWEGRYLVVGFAAGIPKLPLNLPLLKGCDVLGVFWGSEMERNPERHAAAVDALFALYHEGKIRPRVSLTFPLEQAQDALVALASRRTTGKIVVTTR